MKECFKYIYYFQEYDVESKEFREAPESSRTLVKGKVRQSIETQKTKGLVQI